MKKLLIAGGFALLSACFLPAQTPATPMKSTSAGSADAKSNEEMNIRAYIELLRTDVRHSKSQIMGEVMQLDADQSAKFWPIYKDFQAESSALGDKVLALIKKYAENYDNMTDAVADQLASEVLTIEQQKNALKRKGYDRMKQALGAITAARFLQVENQLERVVDLQLAAQLPVISQ
jgi:hypothetical protein